MGWVCVSPGCGRGEAKIMRGQPPIRFMPQSGLSSNFFSPLPRLFFLLLLKVKTRAPVGFKMRGPSLLFLFPSAALSLPDSFETIGRSSDVGGVQGSLRFPALNAGWHWGFPTGTRGLAHFANRCGVGPNQRQQSGQASPGRSFQDTPPEGI